MYLGKTRWGAWQFEPSNRTLVYSGRPQYEIDLDTIQSGSDILNWIMHLEEKDWVTSEMLGDLVKAFARIFADEPWVRGDGGDHADSKGTNESNMPDPSE